VRTEAEERYIYSASGVYRCGTVVLTSRVTLYLEAGAVVLGSKDVRDYTPPPGPGPNDDAGQRHLLFARDAEDITLAGPGKIHGVGPSF
jgi:polygalacturonase